ncbi:flagellar hook-associated protein FlgK [Priestia megaterium]|uniref:flagellar hook-associated protein FlgK n=1 Tax=Priestia megaterium TaxID=1404 RepID=UPI001C238AF0|nr:flagellar hook-associated protein FlgK [Priestia megaterium]MBU8688028.1 flagellar hook-associated protein FlgK [Priestia megaterium]
MSSTFHGLQVAKRGMDAQQAALYTIGHNVSNANTPGYTRQRVSLETFPAYPAPGMNQTGAAGQIGMGVEASTVERIRDTFLDTQYRDETIKVGYWDARAGALEKMEEIMNEPTEDGLSAVFNQFFESIQDVASHPSEAGARSVMIERAEAVGDTFSYLSTSLKTVQGDLQNERDVALTQVNSLLEQISNVNQQIQNVEPNGYLPNDLYDERDRLLDEISKFMPVSLEYTKSSGNASATSEGVVTVQLQTSQGPITLLDGKTHQVNAISLKTNQDSYVTEIHIGDEIRNPESFPQGKLKGLIEASGYIDNSGNKTGVYASMIDDLDEMAYEFVNWFNDKHQQGVTLDGDTGMSFFNEISQKEGAATGIVIADTIKQNTNNIAAASSASSGDDGTGRKGDGQNAQLLSQFRQKVLINSGNQAVSLDGFYQSVIGQMSVDAQQANRLKSNSETLQGAVEQRRQSTSAVSLDEEMTNMIQFQHAYNASARMVTMIDEMLDKVVNGLGTGGR